MKINEKNLCAYSVSQTHIDKEGYLLKKGEVNKSFQRRWFVLKGNLLFYFEKKGDREPTGVIILEGCTIELAECEDQFTFKLVFHGGGGRSYVLAADSQESLEQWMKVLARASYDYLKLVVAGLQKQLEDLNDADNQGKEGGGGGGGGEDGQAPKAPHRQRHNPFNRTQSSNEVTLDPTLALRMRANTVTGGGVGQYLSSAMAVPQRTAPPPPSVSHITVKRRTFAQMHSEYGVPILRDKEEYLRSRVASRQNNNSNNNNNKKNNNKEVKGKYPSDPKPQEEEEEQHQSPPSIPTTSPSSSAVVANLIDI